MAFTQIDRNYRKLVGIDMINPFIPFSLHFSYVRPYYDAKKTKTKICKSQPSGITEFHVFLYVQKKMEKD